MRLGRGREAMFQRVPWPWELIFCLLAGREYDLAEVGKAMFQGVDWPFYCIVISACTVLLFYPNHFIDVYFHMFSTTRVTLYLTSPAAGTVLRLLYTPMLAATVERPVVQGWALKATSFRGARQLMVNHFVLFLKPYFALRRHSQSSSLRDKRSQHHLSSTAAAVVPN
jgi:hypothetical protein